MTQPRFLARFIARLTDGGLIEPGDRVVAAVSGGADSVALLELLNRARKHIDFDLTLCHLNHQLRAAESDADERFVRTLAGTWAIPGYFDSIHVQAEYRRQRGSLEHVARRLRYRFYLAAARSLRANKVAVAHHQDDQCETVLFNLIRGAGLHGLRGIPHTRPLDEITIIRPLLPFAKTELTDYLRANRIDWREDHTNDQPIATRNILRHELIPQLERIHGGFKLHLLALADQAAACEQLIDAHAQSILPAVTHTDRHVRIDTWRLTTAPAVVAEVVRRMMLQTHVPAGKITHRHIDAVLAMLSDPTGRISLPGKNQAWIDPPCLCIGQPPVCKGPMFRLSISQRAFDRTWFDDFVHEKTPYEEAVDADKVQGPPVLRPAQLGERFHPLGAPGTKKIGDFLTDHKVAAHERPGTVVTDNTGPIWLVGWQIDHRVRIDPTTKTALVLTARQQK